MDWGLDAQQATSLVNFGATNSPTTNVDGANTSLDLTGLIDGPSGPRATSVNTAQSSGVSAIMRVNRNGWVPSWKAAWTLAVKDSCWAMVPL